MARWLTFDRKTASTLRKQLPKEQVFEHGAHNAVEYVSVSKLDLVTLLPTGSTGEVAIAVFRQQAGKMTTASAPAAHAQSPKPMLVEKTPQAPAPPLPSVWKVVEPTPAPKEQLPFVKAEPPVPVQASPARSLEFKLPFERQKPPAVRAGGILGTRDELVFEEEPAAKVKKNWWQRFWDEED